MSKKKAVKKATKKPADDKVVAVEAITDSTGVVTIKSVDDPGSVSEGKVAKLKPTVDKDTGVLTMVPPDDEDK